VALGRDFIYYRFEFRYYVSVLLILNNSKNRKENVFTNSIAISPALALKLRASALGPPREALLRPVLAVYSRTW
jgi:hypothetical protein